MNDSNEYTLDLDSYMSFQSSSTFANKNWKLRCNFSTVNDIVEQVQNSSIKYKELCLLVLNSLNEEEWESQLGTDNCLIVDDENVLYLQHNKPHEVLKGMTNVIDIDREMVKYLYSKADVDETEGTETEAEGTDECTIV